MRPFALTRRSKVSIHAPTRGATFVPFSNVVIYDCFNPRTHTGCDLLSGGLSTQAIVSIHAPTRGATTAILAISESGSLFQSTHPHGVRQCINTTYVRVACFNPRTHTGCDTYQTLHACADSVSIHAPTRGATSIISLAWSGIEFQSTHPHGVRLGFVVGKGTKPKFQSTHPHGVRLFIGAKSIINAWFQSTHPHGVRRNVV